MEDISFNQATEEVVDNALKFVEVFTNYIDHLPPLLQRKVTRLKEIDASTKNYCNEAEKLYYQLIADKAINLSNSSKYKTMSKIIEILGWCQELGDEKLEITNQVRTIIDQKAGDVEKKKEDFMASYNPQWKEEIRRKRESTKIDHHRASKRPKRRTQHNSDRHHDKDKHHGNDTNGASASNAARMLSLMGSYKQENASTAKTSYASNNDTSRHDRPISSLSSLSGSKPQLDNLYTPNKREKLQTPSSTQTCGSGDTSTRISSPTTSAASNIATDLLSPGACTSSSNSYLTPKSSASRNGGANSSITSNKSTPKPSASKTYSSTPHKSASKPGQRKTKKKTPKVAPSPRSPSPQGEVPIDPNEPIYCFCKQVSYGSMICCDNKKCRYEWFHFSCVGLTQKPKNNKKWYCTDCQKDRKHRDK